jgi:hypothetical protein
VRLSGARLLKFRGNLGEWETTRIGDVKAATFIAGISGASRHSVGPNALNHDCGVIWKQGCKKMAGPGGVGGTAQMTPK